MKDAKRCDSGDEQVSIHFVFGPGQKPPGNLEELLKFGEFKAELLRF